MGVKLQGKKIAFLATDGFEQSELLGPKRFLEAEGAQCVVVSPKDGTIKGWKDQNWGEEVTVDLALKDATVDHFDALVLPGGQMNPDDFCIPCTETRPQLGARDGRDSRAWKQPCGSSLQTPTRDDGGSKKKNNAEPGSRSPQQHACDGCGTPSSSPNGRRKPHSRAGNARFDRAQKNFLVQEPVEVRATAPEAPTCERVDPGCGRSLTIVKTLPSSDS